MPKMVVHSLVSVVDAHHDGVHTVAFASQKFRDRTGISVIGCSWRDNFHATVPVEHDLEADVGELVPVKPESKGLHELHGRIAPLGCNGEHDVMHHRQRAWHRISTLGQVGYDVSKDYDVCRAWGLRFTSAACADIAPTFGDVRAAVAIEHPADVDVVISWRSTQVRRAVGMHGDPRACDVLARARHGLVHVGYHGKRPGARGRADG
jgi:hypothetical protein